MNDIWGIHWFRRDLRVAGNKALREVWKKTNGKVLGVFCFDSTFLERQDFSHNRFAFFLKTLRKVKQEFNEKGGDLIVVDHLPNDFFSALFSSLVASQKKLPTFVSWNRDYEPFARQRDEAVKKTISEYGVQIITARDHLVFEPHEIKKDGKESSYYQIYSPFSRKWFDLLNTDWGRERISTEKFPKEAGSNQEKAFDGTWKSLVSNAHLIKDQLDEFEQKNQKGVTIAIPEAGSHHAYHVLKKFGKKIEQYKEDRDFPSIDGTSKLSIFLKNGSLTSTQIIKFLDLTGLPWKTDSGPNQYLKEIVWREFYYHILFHRPDLETNSFNANYQNLSWENRLDFFERWKEGTTGFPIVDAGMRELRETGLMHNRVRMIVASFLVKDLLIDWRWGEKYFMQQLLDGDLAPNNGGWQWAESTGCDPQPYFRIFNPTLQAQKFDKDLKYIKKWIPELDSFDYPKPIVEHEFARKRALEVYTAAAKNV